MEMCPAHARGSSMLKSVSWLLRLAAAVAAREEGRADQGLVEQTVRNIKTYLQSKIRKDLVERVYYGTLLDKSRDEVISLLGEPGGKIWNDEEFFGVLEDGLDDTDCSVETGGGKRTWGTGSKVRAILFHEAKKLKLPDGKGVSEEDAFRLVRRGAVEPGSGLEKLLHGWIPDANRIVYGYLSTLFSTLAKVFARDKRRNPRLPEEDRPSEDTDGGGAVTDLNELSSGFDLGKVHRMVDGDPKLGDNRRKVFNIFIDDYLSKGRKFTLKDYAAVAGRTGVSERSVRQYASEMVPYLKGQKGVGGLADVEEVRKHVSPELAEKAKKAVPKYGDVKLTEEQKKDFLDHCVGDLRRHGRGREVSEDTPKILEMLIDGKGAGEIASELGVKDHTVWLAKSRYFDFEGWYGRNRDKVELRKKAGSVAAAMRMLAEFPPAGSTR